MADLHRAGVALGGGFAIGSTSAGAVGAVAVTAVLTWLLFALSLVPVALRWRQRGLAVMHGYFVGSVMRSIGGLVLSVALVVVAGQPAIPTLLSFAVMYLAMMFAEVAVLSRHLRYRAMESLT